MNPVELAIVTTGNLSHMPIAGPRIHHNAMIDLGDWIVTPAIKTR